MTIGPRLTSIFISLVRPLKKQCSVIPAGEPESDNKFLINGMPDPRIQCGAGKSAMTKVKNRFFKGLVVVFIGLLFFIGPAVSAQKTGNTSSADSITQPQDTPQPGFRSLPMQNLQSSDIKKLFNAAADNYRQGHYSEAADKYIAIYRTGIKNHVLFYNLGNCYYRLNRIGTSLLMWEKGLKIKPDNPLLRGNLEFASKRLLDKFEPQEQHFIGAMLSVISNMMSLNGWTVFSVVIFWFLCLLLLLHQLTPKAGLRRVALYFAASFLLVFLIAAAFTGAEYYKYKYDEYGILLERTAQVRSGPALNNPILFILHEGTKVKIESEQTDWIHISVPNGYNGWLPAQTIGKI